MKRLGRLEDERPSAERQNAAAAGSAARGEDNALSVQVKWMRAEEEREREREARCRAGPVCVCSRCVCVCVCVVADGVEWGCGGSSG